MNAIATRVAAALVAAASAGCVSTSSVDLIVPDHPDGAPDGFVVEPSGEIVRGSDCQVVLLFVPLGGAPSLDAAIAEATVSGGDALLDTEIRSGGFYIPPLFGRFCDSLVGEIAHLKAPPAPPVAPPPAPMAHRAPVTTGETFAAPGELILRARAVPGAQLTGGVPAGTPITIKAVTANPNGEWAYVESSANAGWLRASEIR